MSLREKLAQRRATRNIRRSQIGDHAKTVRDQVRSGVALDLAHGKTMPGTFRLFYSSRDGALDVFEDIDGHLTSVNAARLI